jgi:SAM-dependent methyltransferase
MNASTEGEVCAAIFCPVCVSATCRKLFTVDAGHGEFSIQSCRSCRFVFAAPRPTLAELEAFYASAYYDSEDQSKGYGDYRKGAEAHSYRMWSELKAYMPLDRVQPRRVLDVGCATGGFLVAASKDGWEALGVELAPDAVEIARNELGLEVYHGDLTHPALRRSTFGLVTMWHVLEHVLDPVAALKRSYELLRPGGQLFIELPSWNSLGRIARGSSWARLVPPEHLNYFTAQSLRRAMAGVGFRLITSSTHYRCVSDPPPSAYWKRPLKCGSALGADVVSTLGYGGNLRVLGQKP